MHTAWSGSGSGKECFVGQVWDRPRSAVVQGVLHLAYSRLPPYPVQFPNELGVVAPGAVRVVIPGLEALADTKGKGRPLDTATSLVGRPQ